MTHPHRLAPVLTGAATLLMCASLLVGCGNDDSESASDTTALATVSTQPATPVDDTSAPADGSAVTPSICDHWVDVDGAAAALSDPQLPPPAVQASAQIITDAVGSLPDVPAEITEELDVMVAAVTAAGAGDPTALDDSATAAYDTIGAWVHEHCGFTTVEVAYANHTFSGLPATLPAGTTSIAATNEDAEMHVSVIYRVHDHAVEGLDATVHDLMHLGSAELDQQLGAIAEPYAAGAATPPGGSATLTVDFAPGTYLVLCPIPSGFTGDGPPALDAPSHFASGMYSILTVS